MQVLHKAEKLVMHWNHANCKNKSVPVNIYTSNNVKCKASRIVAVLRLILPSAKTHAKNKSFSKKEKQSTKSENARSNQQAVVICHSTSKLYYRICSSPVQEFTFRPALETNMVIIILPS